LGELLKKEASGMAKQKGKLDRILDKLFEHDKKFEEGKCELGSFRNEVLTGLDKVMGELEIAREDRQIAKAKDDEIERRQEKVEAKVG